MAACHGSQPAPEPAAPAQTPLPQASVAPAPAPAPAVHYPTLAEAAAALVIPDGYKQLPPPVPGKLDARRWESIKVRAGQCYAAALVLGEDAQVKLPLHFLVEGTIPGYGKSSPGSSDEFKSERSSFREAGCFFEDAALMVKASQLAMIIVRRVADEPAASDDALVGDGTWFDDRRRDIVELAKGRNGPVSPAMLAEKQSVGTGGYEIRFYARPMTAEERKKHDRAYKLDKCEQCQGQVVCLARYSLTLPKCGELANSGR